jgi:hypothetical protein
MLSVVLIYGSETWTLSDCVLLREQSYVNNIVQCKEREWRIKYTQGLQQLDLAGYHQNDHNMITETQTTGTDKIHRGITDYKQERKQMSRRKDGVIEDLRK